MGLAISRQETVATLSKSTQSFAKHSTHHHHGLRVDDVAVCLNEYRNDQHIVQLCSAHGSDSTRAKTRMAWGRVLPSILGSSKLRKPCETSSGLGDMSSRWRPDNLLNSNRGRYVCPDQTFLLWHGMPLAQHLTRISCRPGAPYRFKIRLICIRLRCFGAWIPQLKKSDASNPRSQHGNNPPYTLRIKSRHRLSPKAPHYGARPTVLQIFLPIFQSGLFAAGMAPPSNFTPPPKTSSRGPIA